MESHDPKEFVKKINREAIEIEAGDLFVQFLSGLSQEQIRKIPILISSFFKGNNDTEENSEIAAVIHWLKFQLSIQKQFNTQKAIV